MLAISSKFAIGVAEVEGGYTAVDGGLEELVHVGHRALGGRGTGITYLCVGEESLLTVLSADDAAPVLGIAFVAFDDDRLLGRTQSVDLVQGYNLDRVQVFLLRLGGYGNGHTGHDVERGTFWHLEGGDQCRVVLPYDGT